MGHGLARKKNGEIAMAYTGPTPWHRLGHDLPADAPIEAWAEKAGYTFKVLPRKVWFHAERDTAPIEYPDRMILVPSDDTSSPFAIVSSDYKVVQPADVMAFFREICEKHHFKMTTAGFLHNRRVAWAQAEIGAESAVADPRDTVKGKLLLSTSFDGSLPTSGRFVAERVVCANTIAIALAEHGGTVAKIRHKTEFSVEDMLKRLGIGTVEAGFRKTMEQFRKLAETPWSHSAMLYNTFELFRPGTILKLDTEQVYKSTSDERSPISHVLRLCVSDAQCIGADMAGASGTAWRWVNAVTQYVDHQAARTQDARLASAWMGKGAEVKTKALELAMASADATPVPLAIASEVAQAGGQSGKDWIASLTAPRDASKSDAPPAGDDDAF